MGSEDLLKTPLVEKLLFPLILGIVGWFVKDFLFAVYARRDELVRKEWEKRLLEVWSPLYYWSGIVMLSGKERGWDRHGLKELEGILAKNAHLLPIAHYNTLIKLLKTVTEQTTVEPRISELASTRKFIYEQIRTFNYLLYRRNGWFDATTYTDFFVSFKYLVRFVSQALKHVMVWLLLVALLTGTYIAYINKLYWIVCIVLVIF